MFDLTGKTAIITGSSKGIGKSIAMQMALHGAKVVVSSRKADACEVVANEMQMLGGRSSGGNPGGASGSEFASSGSSAPAPAPSSDASDDFDDDIPF